MVFIGAGILSGILQVAALKKTIAIITSEKIKVSSGIAITALKLTLILLLFCALAKYAGTAAMLLFACAMTATVIATALFKGIKNICYYNHANGGEN